MPHPIPFTTIRAIAFDFDGVILDSVWMKVNLFLECYEDYGRPLTPAQRAKMLAHLTHHGGVGRVAKFAHYESAIFGREPDPEVVTTLARRYSELLMPRIDACPELPGARAFLERMQGRLSLHLISGTTDDDLRHITQRRDFARYFRTIAGSPTTKPVAFADVLRHGGWQPAEVLAIGDSWTEFDAARELGMPFAGIVAPGEPNPFPDPVLVYADMAALGAAWDEADATACRGRISR
ncbi:HAD family hydrolase [Burkholderia plantarii]|uniref:HAD family hydrolase n=1 Tax=Burkholderia plantarii TaxID=41899 RepID=UPI0006D88DA5|nr:HAD hydrolase-like protein [Burkholderia plantarii]ALK32570.1 Haloacid dehalogenase domain-containing protein hydrolase [Burkholderia plantarii]GLZ19943.1 hydrolase [Burkholderia plantarii]